MQLRGECIQCYQPSDLNPGESRSLVHRDVIGPVAFDLVLRLIGARVIHVPLVVRIARVNRNDRSGDEPRFGIPANVVTDLQTSFHVFHRDSRIEHSNIRRPFSSFVKW